MYCKIFPIKNCIGNCFKMMKRDSKPQECIGNWFKDEGMYWELLQNEGMYWKFFQNVGMYWKLFQNGGMY